MAKIIIYTTPYCPFCVRAIQLLQHKGVEFKEIDVFQNQALRQEMERLSGRHTVPQIFIDDVSIGGCDDLYELDATGKLDKLLN